MNALSFASRALFAIVIAAAGSGCGASSLHEFSAQGYASARPEGAPIKSFPIAAEAEQGVVLGITDNTDYVNVAFDRLKSQCPGEIVGVSTRYSTKLGFYSWRNDIRVEGMCLRD
jgi:hypothetical protein